MPGRSVDRVGQHFIRRAHLSLAVLAQAGKQASPQGADVAPRGPAP